MYRHSPHRLIRDDIFHFNDIFCLMEKYFSRQSLRRTIFFATFAATHDSLRDSRGDARYILHDISPFGLPTQGRYFVVHSRASLRVSRKISCVAATVAQNIVRRRDCREKYRVSLLVSSVVLMKEGRD